MEFAADYITEKLMIYYDRFEINRKPLFYIYIYSLYIYIYIDAPILNFSADTDMLIV